MPKGFYFLIGAQFASGLADNALLILGIYFLNEQGYPGWWAPLLKFSLTLAYVLLASVVGPLADAFSKSRLMACMNALKMAGVLLLLAGVHPLFAFALIGLAASVYAPAKYGLATEAVPARLLVRANAWIEVSMVLSVIFGIALGGALTGLSEVSAPMVFAVSTQTWPAMAVVMGVYLTAAMLNVGLSPMDKRGAIEPLTWHAVRIGTFWKSNQKLWRDPLGGVSLYVTTLYWGVGAVMQFAVLLWAQGSLGMTLKFGAYLQAVRDNEDAARAVGVNPFHVKTWATVMSGARLVSKRTFQRLRPLSWVWQRASTNDTVNSWLTSSRSVAGSRSMVPPSSPMAFSVWATICGCSRLRNWLASK